MCRVVDVVQFSMCEDLGSILNTIKGEKNGQNHLLCLCFKCGYLITAENTVFTVKYGAEEKAQSVKCFPCRHEDHACNPSTRGAETAGSLKLTDKPV